MKKSFHWGLYRPGFSWLITLLLVASLFPANGAEPNSPALKRWAILASPRVQQSGLADLLTTELSHSAGLELVERNQVESAARELALGQIYGAADAAKRLKLGQFLKADALVILKDEPGDGRELIRVIISESRQGARLRLQTFANAPAELPRVAHSIAAEISEVRSNFSGGLDQIIGVSPFISRDLTHDHDNFQAGFANLLRNALASFPRVAVIEIEEAQAIRRELELTGGEIAGRKVPIFVEGEFQTRQPPGQGVPTVKVSVTIKRAGGGAETLERPALSLSEVPKFFNEEVPASILRAKQRPVGSFSPDEQFSELTARAVSFARIGMIEEAIGLREAAVVLKEDDIPLRKLLVEDYDFLLKKLGRELYSQRGPSTGPGYVAIRDRALSGWRVMCSHLDYLVMNGQLTQEQYDRSPARPGDVPGVLRGEPSPQHDTLLAEDTERWQMLFPFASKLSSENPARPQALPYAARLRIARINDILAFNHFDGSGIDYKSVFELLEQLPDNTPPLYPLVYRLSSAQAPFSHELDKQWEKNFPAFLEQLRHSQRPMNQIYGRYSSLCGKLRAETRKPTEGPEPLAEADALIADYRSLCDAQKISGSNRDSFQVALTDVRFQLARQLAPPAAQASLPPRPPRPEPVWGHIRMAEIPFRIKTANGTVIPFKPETSWKTGNGFYSIAQFTKCGDHLDVAWATGAILYIRTRDLFEEVLVDPAASFDDAKWDGERLWVATRHKGILLLNGTGKLVGEIGAKDGLPPSDHGLKLEVIAPNKVCAVGSFGQDQRAWCAIVDFTGGTAHINIFHTATRVLTSGEDRRNARVNAADFVFTPTWLHLYEDETGKRNHLWIARDHSRPTERPLEINLDTLTVGMAPLSVSADRAEAVFSRHGDVLAEDDFSIIHHAAPGKLLPDGNATESICVPRNSEGVSNGGLGKVLIERNGFVYVPGLIWFRLDPKTMKAEQLCPDRLPMQASSSYYAASAHYGLVGWNYREPFRQFTVDEEDTQLSSTKGNSP